MDMPAPNDPQPNRTVSIFEALLARPGRVLAVIGLVSALLLMPLIAMAPTESASTEPDGPVFDARDRIDEAFVSSVHPILFVIEDNEGDLLRAEPLRQLLAASSALRDDDELGATLFRYFDVESEAEVEGLLTLADLIDAELPNGLAEADDAAVKQAGGQLIERLGVRSEILALSVETSQDDDGQWVVPAITPMVLADNQLLGFGNFSVNLGGGTEVEEYNRDVQELLRSADGLATWGVAIDVNLTSQEQGAIAGPYIGLTVLAVLLIVGLTFRSYWVLATVAAALLLLIVWLKGITNLIGLKDDLVLSLIVPIAMISFGVDFAFHAIGRYREERAAGRKAERAFVVGLASVSSALVLALTSDTVAFLSNVSAGIESIVQFGVGAAIALGSAYVLLGIVSPLVIATIERQVPPPSPGRRSMVVRVAASIGASALTMASVLLLVFVLPAAGAALATVTIALTLVLPFVIKRRHSDGPAVGDLPQPAAGDRLAVPIGTLVSILARRSKLVVPAALALSVVAAVFAVRVPAEFDVEDFFSADSGFVVALNEVDQHVGARGGEQAQLYVEGDLTDPAALAMLQDRVTELRDLETERLASVNGDVTIDGGIFSVFEAVWASPTALEQISQASGLPLTDVDQDRIPDTREQVVALLETTAQTGVPFDETRLALTPDDVATSVKIISDGSGSSATVFGFGLVNSRNQASVDEAYSQLEPIAQAISQDLDGSFVQLTGSPFIRDRSLDATNRALSISLPIALMMCLAVSSTFLRSLRYGVASVVPIVMVVTWLYGFMEIAGFAINIVTATIAAVSIGIGIDFALHYISRYREELDRHGRRDTAIRIASEGTGTALVASAMSSAIGFGIMAFAPMPLFAAYGLLTALMIVMALIATLVVLPSVLMLITSDTQPRILRAPAASSHDRPVTVTADR